MPQTLTATTDQPDPHPLAPVPAVEPGITPYSPNAPIEEPPLPPDDAPGGGPDAPPEPIVSPVAF